MAPKRSHHSYARSTFKRKRRIASKTASLAQWKASNGKIVGAHVIDLNCLSQGIQEVSKHNSKCHGQYTITREVQREGLASILEVACDKCMKSFHIESSPKTAGSKQINKRYSVNVGAV